MQERDVERSARKEVEIEIAMLKERIESSQRTIDAQRNELNMRDSRLGSLEIELRTNSKSVRSTSAQYSLFIDQLASLLGETEGSGHCNEDFIRRRIEGLVYSTRDLRIVSIFHRYIVTTI